MFHPLKSAVFFGVLAPMIFFLQSHPVSEELFRSSVVLISIVLLCAIITALYLDSVLGKKHQMWIIISGGLCAQIIAASLDYPSLTVLANEILTTAVLFFMRGIPFGSLLKLMKRINAEASKQQPEVSTCPIAEVVIPVPKATPLIDSKRSIPFTEEMPLLGPNPSTLFRNDSPSPQPLQQHYLVASGLIVNPISMRTIKIGGKRYMELLEEGYTPDFEKGVLVSASSTKGSVSM